FNWFINPDDLAKDRQWNVDINSEAGDPVFVNPKIGDFTVSNESKAFGMGWKNFAMDKFGVQKPALKAMAETPEIPEIMGIENELQSAIHFYSGQIKNLSTDGEISATGMPDKKGVLVLSPPTDGVFKTLKLLRNDVILKVNGVHVNSVAELQP